MNGIYPIHKKYTKTTKNEIQKDLKLQYFFALDSNWILFLRFLNRCKILNKYITSTKYKKIKKILHFPC
ncbi:hypothetical protein SAMN05444481_12179 [Flavobacterium frigidimaris]|nr:hypothetical protein SAMN05444481_12179 [Flavobacterium frigidimaris]